ncbi:Imm1 family immunity protein [Saccharopolyspora flava]|uniref:Immunity protein Imm1 n=1 Tax=Saccharopolyspora flava TaxID=95161 RepID=A0A1I6SU73_9PSEU|nr:Imm1 family immunity protein [Saccharopolyspora flava]SFS80466.1 Immunity protein Imm1 [Saccharopolyspora flava]
MKQLSVNESSTVVLNSVEELRAALRDEAASGAYCVQLFPDPRSPGEPGLLVGVNGDRGVLVWSHPGLGESLVAVNGTNTEVVWYGFGSEENDFPPNTELPLAVVMAAAAEFLRTGRRPTNVEWCDEDDAWDRRCATAER